MTFSNPTTTVAPREEVSKRKSKFSPDELERRRERMRKLNEAGITGPQFGKLGGRPRKGETAEQARERRQKEREQETLDRLLEMARPVVTPHVPSGSPARLTDEEESAARAFLTGHGRKRPRGYAVRARTGA